MALTASLDKTEYSPGDTMKLTVKTDVGDRNRNKPISITIHVDSNGLPSPLTDVNLSATVVQAPSDIIVTDSGRVWTKSSDTGTVAVFTATA